MFPSRLSRKLNAALRGGQLPVGFEIEPWRHAQNKMDFNRIKCSIIKEVDTILSSTWNGRTDGGREGDLSGVGARVNIERGRCS